MGNTGYGRGKLTEADYARIAELHERGYTTARIAQLIGRHQATVSWYQYNNGMRIASPCPDTASSYRRGSKVCWTWDKAEEARAIALRKEGKTFDQIAKLVNAEFHRDRCRHAIHVRLVMSSSREE